MKGGDVVIAKGARAEGTVVDAKAAGQIQRWSSAGGQTRSRYFAMGFIPC